MGSSYHGDHGSSAHVLDESWVERPVLQVDVVLLQQLLRRLLKTGSEFSQLGLTALMHRH